MAPNFCPFCGERVIDKAKLFCPDCGYKYDLPMRSGTQTKGYESEDEVEPSLDEDDGFFDDGDEIDDPDLDDEEEDFFDDEDDLINAELESPEPNLILTRAVTPAQTLVKSLPPESFSAYQASHPARFWHTLGGKTIRWVAYLPIAFILLSLIEILTAGFLIWLFDGDMRMFVIVGVFLGGLFFVLPFVVGTYYGVILLANRLICPTPHIGVVIFATLYFLGSIHPVISIFTSGFTMATIVTLVIIKVALLATTLFSVVDIYAENE